MPIQKQCRIYNFYWIAWGPKQYSFLVPNRIKRQAKSQNKAYIKPILLVTCTTVLAVVNHTAHLPHLLLFLALNYYLFTLKYEGWKKFPIIGKTIVNLFWEFPKLTSFCFSPLAAHWFTNTVQTRFSVLQLAASTRPLLSTWWNSWQFANQPTTLMVPVFVFPLCARTRWVRDLFLMLHRLSGRVSRAKLDHQTHSHLLNHLWNLTSSSYPIDWVRARVCVCARARMCLQKFVLTVFWLKSPKILLHRINWLQN